MTIQALINYLEKAKKKIGPRARVTCDVKELRAAIEGFDFTHWELNCFDITTVPWSVDDSFELADGSERTKTVAVLS